MCGNNDIKLSGQKRKALREAIMSAYPNITQLKMMLSDELDCNLNKIAGGSNLEEVVFQLIYTAEAQGRLKELICGASKGNPKNTDLQNIKEELGIHRLSDNIDIRDNNCSAIREKYNELFKCLENIKDLELMSKICRDSIQKINKNIDFVANFGELEYIETIDTIKKILLKNSTPPETGAQTIVEFVTGLLNTEEIKELEKDKLRQIMNAVAKEHNIDLPTVREENSSKNLQYYLLVTATPKGNNEFHLTAELKVDEEVIPIDELNYKQREIDCKLNEISQKIYDFIKVFRKQYLKPLKNNYNLTIELFMPLQYLDENIDTHEITAEFDQKIAIGDKYQFIIRCRERITEEDGDFLMELRKKCENFSHQFEDIPQKDSYQEWDWGSCNLRKLVNNWRDNGILGTIIICGLPENDKVKREFFISIIQGGVPICLWTRSNNLQDTEDGFNKILTEKLKSLNDFDKLSESVWDIRKKAHAETKKENYLGYNLGFLCDNPYRIPSCLDQEESGFIEIGE